MVNYFLPEEPIHNGNNLSVHQWINGSRKCGGVYMYRSIHTRILLVLTKGNLAIYDNMDENGGPYAK